METLLVLLTCRQVNVGQKTVFQQNYQYNFNYSFSYFDVFKDEMSSVGNFDFLICIARAAVRILILT